LRHHASTFVLASTLALLVVMASFPLGQAPAGGQITILARDGRRLLPTTEIQGRQSVALDDLANFFAITVREDNAARAVTVTHRNQTIVLTPDQSLVSVSGRLVSLPAPLTRQGRRWLVPVEFISRALSTVYEPRLDYRPVSRLLIVGDLRVPRVRAQFDESPGQSRITMEINPKTATTVTQEGNRVNVRFDADMLDPVIPPAATQMGLITGVRVVDPATVQIDLSPRFTSFKTGSAAGPGQSVLLTIELVGMPLDSSSTAPATPGGANPSTAAGGTATAPGALPPVAAGELPVFTGARPSIRTVVIDPGHGGDDTGVKGAGGALEKDVALNVARRLKSAIETRLGLRVLLTREGDAMVDDDRRAAIANNNKADLYISLHANGSPRPETRGASIFTLGLDRFGEDARRTSQAAREVLPIYGGGAREVALIGWDMAQASHIEDSVVFAGMTEQRLRDVTGLPSVAYWQAPMRTLAGTNMPAVLVEIGYLSNPEEEKLLASPAFQNNVAQAMSEAVVSFRERVEGASPVPDPAAAKQP
jgi:N-acetylmuramoyl-L-alanine amidase